MMSALNIDLIIHGFRSRFQARGNPERAVFERKYHKTDRLFHGVSVGEIRASAREFKKSQKDLGKGELFLLCDELWESEYFDLRSLGIALHEAYLKLLDFSDMPRLEAMLRDSGGWGHIDWICARLVDPLVETNPDLKAVLESWAQDDSFWMRRAALLGQLIQLRGGFGDFPLFARLAGGMLAEKEFFIRKAIGWVLREVSKKRPQMTHQFLVDHLDQVSPLTFKEGFSPANFKTLKRRRANARTVGRS